MKLKFVFFIAVIFSVMMTAFGQSSLITTEQKFIKNATENALYIIRQDYVLQDTSSVNPNEYGYGGNEYFGREYTLGIVSDGYLWCDDRITHPWVFDDNYEDYEDNEELKPALTENMMIRPVTGHEFSEVSFSRSDNHEMDSLLEKLNIVRFELEDSLAEIPNIRELKEGKLWLVLIWAKNNFSENDTCALNYFIYSMEDSLQNKLNDSVLMTPVAEPSVPEGGKLIGGIYFKESISSGKIEFPVAGILHKKPVHWYISTLPEKEESEAQDTIKIIPQPGDYAKLHFIYEDGFNLNNISGITVDCNDKTYSTDDNGNVKIPLTGGIETSQLYLNEVEAECIEKGEEYEIKCKYNCWKKRFEPKKNHVCNQNKLEND